MVYRTFAYIVSVPELTPVSVYENRAASAIVTDHLLTGIAHMICFVIQDQYAQPVIS